MFRKLAFALAAIFVLGAASVATTTEASARGHGGGHGFHGGGHRGGGGFHRGGGFRGGWHGGRWHRGWHRGWGGPRFYRGPRYFYGGYSGCYVRRLVMTPWGPRYRLINRCY